MFFAGNGGASGAASGDGGGSGNSTDTKGPDFFLRIRLEHFRTTYVEFVWLRLLNYVLHVARVWILAIIVRTSQHPDHFLFRCNSIILIFSFRID